MWKLKFPKYYRFPRTMRFSLSIFKSSFKKLHDNNFSEVNEVILKGS